MNELIQSSIGRPIQTYLMHKLQTVGMKTADVTLVSARPHGGIRVACWHELRKGGTVTA